MIASCQLNRLASKRRGGVLVLLAIMLPLLLLMSTYAINVAYVESVNTDVQIATDAAVQAAGRAYIETADENAALAAAQDAASRNPINGVTMPIVMRDLEFGISQRRNLSGRYNFTPVSGGALGNAVRMTTRSVNEAATPILKPIFPTMGTTLEIRPIRSAVSTQSTMDVALVIDRSGSMAYASDESSAGGMNPPRSAPPGWDFDQPVPPNARWLDMVASVNEFAKYLRDSPQRELLSLSTYSDVTTTDVKLTTRYGDVRRALDQYSLIFPGGSTAIGQGLLEGLGAVQDPSVGRSYAVKVIVLLTDGIHDTGLSPESAANELEKGGVVLFAITFSDFADKNRMRSLAKRCGGEHFHATNAAQLTAAFDEIARNLPSLMTQ